MSSIFHCAVLGGNLDATVPFYTDILGCRKDNSEEGQWVDIDFWGNELTLHQSQNRSVNERHQVDMGNVAVPHFGIHLERADYDAVKQRLAENNVPFLDKPYTRFASGDYEQETFFIEDPNGNVIEIKSLKVAGQGLTPTT